jgi:transcriptional regulator with PAS, ATPase and Fis domain
VPAEDADQRNLPIFLKKTPEEVDREILYRALFEIKKDIIELKDLVVQKHLEVKSPSESEVRKEVIPLDEMEKEAIKSALDQTRGNKRKAAQKLKISERTLYRKIKEYDIHDD